MYDLRVEFHHGTPNTSIQRNSFVHVTHFHDHLSNLCGGCDYPLLMMVLVAGGGGGGGSSGSPFEHLGLFFAFFGCTTGWGFLNGKLEGLDFEVVASVVIFVVVDGHYRQTVDVLVDDLRQSFRHGRKGNPV